MPFQGHIDDVCEARYALVDFSEPPSRVLYDVDLSVSRALGLMDDGSRHNYEALYAWFIGNTENGRDYGSREYGRGQRLPGVDEDFAHAAQRGIHVPAHRKYAATVTIKRGSLYDRGNLDGRRVELPDGTWLLSYAAHRNNTAGETASTWNDGLLNCCYDGVPVGVFIESEKGYYRALAFVEDYDARTDTFLLHGPVTTSNSDAFIAPARADAELAGLPVDLSILEVDSRARNYREVYCREGQNEFRKQLLNAYSGRCAVCGGNVEKTLQAGHILNYRGRQSNVIPNGILLRSDIHLLFDNSLLAIRPDSLEIDLHPSLEGSEYERLFGKRIELPRAASLHPDERLLAIKYSKFREALAS